MARADRSGNYFAAQRKCGRGLMASIMLPVFFALARYLVLPRYDNHRILNRENSEFDLLPSRSVVVFVTLVQTVAHVWAQRYWWYNFVVITTDTAVSLLHRYMSAVNLPGLVSSRHPLPPVKMNRFVSTPPIPWIHGRLSY